MSRMIHECDRELRALQQHYNLLKETAERRLSEEHTRIGEFRINLPLTISQITDDNFAIFIPYEQRV